MIDYDPVNGPDFVGTDLRGRNDSVTCYIELISTTSLIISMISLLDQRRLRVIHIQYLSTPHHCINGDIIPSIII